jgi:hypothetical protein
VVTEDLDRMQCPLKFGSPFLESPNNSHQLLVIYFVVAFGQGVFLREEGHRVKDSLVVILG